MVKFDQVATRVSDGGGRVWLGQACDVCDGKMCCSSPHGPKRGRKVRVGRGVELTSNRLDEPPHRRTR